MAELFTADVSAGEGEDAPKKDDAALLEEAKKRFKLCEEWWGPKQKLWLGAARFRALDQWPDEIRATREKDRRPCLTVDKCNQYVRQVVNDGRQNRPAVKIRPVDDNGDEEIAEALQGIVRHICDHSNADEALDTSLDHAAGNGYGFMRVLTDYAHKDTFNQEILVGRIRNPIAVMLDPNFKAADGSDAKYGFVVDELPKEEFKRQYPKAAFTDWEANASKYSDGWMTDENVRFVEYFYMVETDRDMHLLADGSTIDDETYKKAIGEGVQVPAIRETRSIPKCEVKWCRMSGAEILEKKEWLGIYIPLIIVVGNESDIDGEVIYTGLIQAAMDAQKLYNFMATAFAEVTALTPKAPYVAATGQVEDHPEWEDANVQNYSVLKYDPVDVNGTPLPPPVRQQPAAIPPGYAQAMQHAEHDIQASMGMYNASVGEKSNEKSGKAIMARQREGDTATFHYQDNLSRAIRYLGRILVDLIPKIYDSQRVVRILGEDGQSTPASIDPNQQEPVQKQGSKTIYNLNIGTYDVSVSAGPSYTTKRQEAAEAMMQLAQSSPEVWQFAGDIMVRNLDWPGADELADRFKLMLPPPIQQAEQAKEQGQDPKVAAVMAQAQQAMQQKDQQIQAAEAGIAERDQELQRLTQELQAAKLDSMAAQQKAMTDQYNAETARMKMEAEANNQPVDTTALETLRLEYEDRWKKLAADTQVVVEGMKLNASANAAAQKPTPGEEPEDGQTVDAPRGPAPTSPDTSAALAVAIEGFTAALGQNAAMLQQMTKPKRASKGSDGSWTVQ